MKKGAERSRTSQCFGNFDGKHSKERHSSGKHRFSHPEKKSCETSAFFFSNGFTVKVLKQETTRCS